MRLSKAKWFGPFIGSGRGASPLVFGVIPTSKEGWIALAVYAVALWGGTGIPNLSLPAILAIMIAFTAAMAIVIAFTYGPRQ